MNKIETGYKDLDELLDGGIDLSSLVVLGSRTGIGKSLFLNNLFKNMKMKNVFFNFEKGHIITNDQNINLWSTCRYDDSFINNIYKYIAEDYKLFFIDSLQLIEFDDYKSIAKQLKRITKEYKITIIITSQLCRKVEERPGHRPTINDFPHETGIEEYADLVLGLLRRDYYDAMDKPGIAELLIMKNRYGNIGNINLTYKKYEKNIDDFGFYNYARLSLPSERDF